MAKPLVKIIDAQLRKTIKQNNEMVAMVVDSEKINRVYVLVKNLPEPYKGGEYYFLLKIPEEFPDKVPELEALTPNGVYGLGGAICISIGTFHQDDNKVERDGSYYGWKPSLGLYGFAVSGIINGILSFGSSDTGIRIIQSTNEEKNKMAKESISYNKVNNANIYSLFEELRKSKPDLSVWN